MQSYVYDNVAIRKRRRLPHWDAANALYFVTFRLHDAVPLAVLTDLAAKRDERRTKAEELSPAARIDEEDRAEREYRRAIQRVLDEGLGTCYMLEPRVASLVEGALRFFDEQRYSLCAWSVMPNHVHTIYRSFPGWPLDKILHSWKSYTGSEANKMLNRRGELWQEEYFDVLIRDARELQATVRYVLENPLKAGLRDWTWVGSKAETIAALLSEGGRPAPAPCRNPRNSNRRAGVPRPPPVATREALVGGRASRVRPLSQLAKL